MQKNGVWDFAEIEILAHRVLKLESSDPPLSGGVTILPMYRYCLIRKEGLDYHIRQVLIKVRGVYRGVSVYKGVYVRVTIYIYGYYSPYYSILPYKEGVMCIDGGVYRWRCDVYRWRCVYEYLS